MPTKETSTPKKSITSLFHAIPVALLMIGAAGLVAILLVGVVLSDRVELVFKSPNQQVVLEAAPVCGEDIFDEFNKAATVFEEGKYSAVYAQVQSSEDYLDDVNCVYVGLRHHLLEGNADEATDYFTRFTQLNDRGNHLSDRLAIPANRESLQGEVEALRGEGGTESNDAGEEDESAVTGED